MALPSRPAVTQSIRRYYTTSNRTTYNAERNHFCVHTKPGHDFTDSHRIIFALPKLFSHSFRVELLFRVPNKFLAFLTLPQAFLLTVWSAPPYFCVAPGWVKLVNTTPHIRVELSLPRWYQIGPKTSLMMFPRVEVLGGGKGHAGTSRPGNHPNT